MTVPDRAFTAEQLIRKHKSGMAIPMANDMHYDDQENHSSGIDPRTLDLVDRQAMMLENQEKINDLRLKRESYAKKQQQLDEAIKREQQEHYEWVKKQRLASKKEETE